MNVRTVVGTGACVLVLAGLGLGFSAIGSPRHNRLRSADARVQQAIYEIADDTTVSADASVTKTGPVYPASMEADLRHAIVFEKRSKDSYALCATFNLADDAFSQNALDSPNWAHPAGRHCYRFRLRHLASDPYAPVPLTERR